jgi:cytoskeletal protein RodZ
MDEFGQKLRRAREERGVSLRDIATRTKISLTALEALERSEFHRLPGGIFSRALVRSYASEVGLDPDTTVDNFLTSARQAERESAERGATSPSISRDDREFLERQRRALRMLQLGVVVIAAGAVALLVWQMRKVVAPSAEQEPPVTLQAPRPQPPPPPDTVMAPVPAATPADPVPLPGPESVPPVQTAPLPGPAGGQPGPAVSPAPAAPAAGSDGGQAPAASGSVLPAGSEAPPLVVELTATADSQVTVARDGAPPETQMLRAGQRQRLTAVKEVDLTVADAGALTWTINGKPAQPMGQPGTSVRVRVTPANAQAYLP